MLWQSETVTEAFRIFMELLKKGQLHKKDGSFYTSYHDLDVREIIEQVIEKEVNVKIFTVDEWLYMVPNIDNNTLAYSNQELRELMKLKDNDELYLFHFINLVLISRFYNSNDQAMHTQDYISLTNLLESVQTKLDEFTTLGDEQVEEFLQEKGLDIRGILTAWNSKKIFDEAAKNHDRTRNNQIAFLTKILRFLEDEGLIQFLEKKEIRITQKTERLVGRYYYNTERKDMVLNLLK